MLEGLLKYDPSLFARGRLELDVSLGVFAVGVLLIVALTGIALGYAWPARARAADGAARVRDRVVLWALRAALLSLLWFALVNPRLVVEVDEPVRGHVAVLLDDSLSMRIEDVDGAQRAERVVRDFLPGRGRVARALEARFDTRYLRFASDVSPMTATDALGFTGAHSDLAAALARVARADDGGALAEVVLVTDGGGVDGRRSIAALNRAAASLRAEGVRLNVVGVGAARHRLDVELAELDVPREALRGDVVDATIGIEQRGLAGRAVRLALEEEGVRVAERTITLNAEGARTTVSVALALRTAGARRLRASLERLEGEVLAENNALVRLVEVRGDPLRVLHVEGEPRFEVKFLRRAVAGDDGIRLRSLVRTAENKFYRLGVDDADELSDGLPTRDEDLFKYDALVIGSVGNDLLDPAQQARLNAFVARRGGGVVMLGGRSAFTEGGFAGTPVAGLAPVEMPAAAASFRKQVRIRPTAAGLGDRLLEVAAEKSSEQAFAALPPLTMVNPIREAKPGATWLLSGDDGSGEPLVVLAWHRYGRGTVAAFAVRDSWRWQMHADVPLEDLSHERLWRQLLRHVARPAKGRLRLHPEPVVAGQGESVLVHAEVLDAAYHPAHGVDPVLRVTAPDGSISTLGLEPAVHGAPGYRARFLAKASGRYELRLSVGEGDDETISVNRTVEVTARGNEFHGAEVDVRGLTRLAELTGGRFLAAKDAHRLPDLIDDTRSVRRVEQRLLLWDMPALLLLALLLAGLEWVWRRRRQLP